MCTLVITHPLFMHAYTVAVYTSELVMKTHAAVQHVYIVLCNNPTLDHDLHTCILNKQ